jgi:hypothetical protein
MLLTAMLDGSRVYAPTFTADAWAELQRSEDRKQMVIPVCNVRAVAKTRGPHTRYFAHHRKDGCKVDHGGESPQHLAMKEALKLCIDRVPDWHAIVEHPHPSREWIIDVLAESDDFTRRVAFEVQLSSQTPENYFARSQRYFDSGAFPVWLIPRQLEYHETKVPVVVTGFGKTSEIPDDPSELLALHADQNFVITGGSIGVFVEALLRKGPSWIHGTPNAQAEAQRAVAEAAALAAEAERMKQEAINQQIGATNDLSASPESAFGHHTVRTRIDIYIWGSLTCCWGCGEPMLVWDARTWAWGGGMPGLQVKAAVDHKRLENHPEVHRAVDKWIRAAKPDVQKAAIKKRPTRASGRLYSAFVCPSCDSTMGQFHRVHPSGEVVSPRQPRPRTAAGPGRQNPCGHPFSYALTMPHPRDSKGRMRLVSETAVAAVGAALLRLRLQRGRLVS